MNLHSNTPQFDPSRDSQPVPDSWQHYPEIARLQSRREGIGEIITECRRLIAVWEGAQEGTGFDPQVAALRTAIRVLEELEEAARSTWTGPTEEDDHV